MEPLNGQKSIKVEPYDRSISPVLWSCSSVYTLYILIINKRKTKGIVLLPPILDIKVNI